MREKKLDNAVQIRQKHPFAIRWFHWFNFPILAIMIWSGLRIYWANDEYGISIGNNKLFTFFPEYFYDLFGLAQELAEGMAWHFAFMWLFIVNGICYVAYTFISGEWRWLLPNKNSFREALEVTLHDLGIIKGKPAIGKYNGAQRITYTAIILMGAASMITGLAIYKPIQLSWLASMLGGYKAARVEHFYLTIGYVLFFIIHIIQVIRAGWNNFRSMVAGFEIIKRKNISTENKE